MDINEIYLSEYYEHRPFKKELSVKDRELLFELSYEYIIPFLPLDIFGLGYPSRYRTRICAR